MVQEKLSKKERKARERRQQADNMFYIALMTFVVGFIVGRGGSGNGTER